jgi:hypothetical protein
VFITETDCVYCAVRSAHSVYLCVLFGSENNQKLFHYTALTDWCLLPKRSVFTARYVLHTQCIYVFCSDLRKNSDYFSIQHKLTGVYYRDGVCSLRGTFCPHCIYVLCSCSTPVSVCLLSCAQCSTTESECVSTVLCAVFNAGIGECVYCTVHSVQRRFRSVCLLSCSQCSTPVSECMSTVLCAVFNAGIGVCVDCPVRSVQRRYRSVPIELCAVFNAGIEVCVYCPLRCVQRRYRSGCQLYSALCSTPVSECLSPVLCKVFYAGIGVCV